MSYSGYVIKNCSAKDLESACPKRWDSLKPAFSDMVRHCDHCNKKVYLCETDEQIKFYSSVKFCIAVAEQEGLSNVEGIPPSSTASIFHAVDPAVQLGDGPVGSINRPLPNVWRRPSSPGLQDEVQHDDNASLLRMQQVPDDSDIPAFLRKRSK
ncbi:MAG: hypothetical protein EOP04_24715 [Proteobacteria bacterium]|jgi:hypothetical protein|nr:MAG: hypothetical protein EOP04_24715 [Pseudomonadota bacterium]